MTRRLGALGTWVWDRIRLPDGEPPREQWGGMIYSLAALCAAAPDGWTVRPIAKVGADLAPDVRRVLHTFARLDAAPALLEVPQPNNRVELRYRDAAHRDELLTGGVPPWRWDELEPHLAGVDALYLNFLSGMEMELADVERLRDGFRGPIYADLHSLFLGPPGDGPRLPAPLSDWERWLACFDLVQLNEGELAMLDEGRFLHHPEQLLRYGPRAVLVTHGDSGATVAARGGADRSPLVPGAAHGEPVAVRVPHPGPVAGDPTGCGDVWGATAWCALLGGATMREAAERAHRAAAAKVREPVTERLGAALERLR